MGTQRPPYQTQDTGASVADMKHVVEASVGASRGSRVAGSLPSEDRGTTGEERSRPVDGDRFKTGDDRCANSAHFTSVDTASAWRSRDVPLVCDVASRLVTMSSAQPPASDVFDHTKDA
jgi:hypothetical protein